MPIKYKNSGNDLINNVPFVEKLKESESYNKMDDMMSEITSERLKMKASSMINMVGVLTPVLYYQAVHDSTNNYNTDSTGPSDIAFDVKKFIEIKNFRIKLSGETNLENENEEDEQSYISTGSFIVLPRTIQPSPGDMFMMEYYGRNMCYQVTTVNTVTYENDSGFECEYTLYKADYKIPSGQIAARRIYRHELIGTTYRAVFDEYEVELINKFEKLYKHMETVFNNLFYDKEIDGYLCKNYDIERNKSQELDNYNINTLGKRYGVFRANTSDDSRSHQVIPREVTTQYKIYDNLLNIFMSKNHVFRDFNGLLLAIEPKMGIDNVNYRRSVFGCVETQSISNYRNTFVLPVKIERLTPEINAYFVGKFNVIHDDEVSSFPELFEFFPKSLIEKIKNGKNQDMNLKFSGIVYNSIESVLIDTIVRYIYKRTDDFVDRFLYLFDNTDNLYEHNISYANIYYLFPFIGYIIERKLEEMYTSNSLLNT